MVIHVFATSRLRAALGSWVVERRVTLIVASSKLCGQRGVLEQVVVAARLGSRGQGAGAVEMPTDDAGLWVMVGRECACSTKG